MLAAWLQGWQCLAAFGPDFSAALYRAAVAGMIPGSSSPGEMSLSELLDPPEQMAPGIIQ